MIQCDGDFGKPLDAENLSRCLFLLAFRATGQRGFVRVGHGFGLRFPRKSKLWASPYLTKPRWSFSPPSQEFAGDFHD